ncbi:MAG: chemotaxis protein CheW [Gemmatimonadales bacterium]|jgi:purine-binding chemotaxis protein CheW
MSARKLLLFRTGGRVFAVDARAVREILPAMPPTRIPGSPAAVRGLVNVRGTLVTVVDARVALGAEAAGSGASDEGMNGGAGRTLVLVERSSCPIGLIVDDVLDLVTVDDDALTAGEAIPGVRPGVVTATGTAGGERFAQLATDVLLEPLLA